VLLSLSVPADNDRGPQYVEQVLAAMHQANLARLPITLTFASLERTLRLFCRVPPELAPAMMAQLGAQYPDATIERLPDAALTPADAHTTWSAESYLRPDVFPIRRYAQFEDLLNRNISDPLTAIFAALAPNRHATARIDITIRPAARRRMKQARKLLRKLASPFFRAHPAFARAYAVSATHPRTLIRLAGRCLGTIVRKSSSPFASGIPATARSHDREDSLQAAADKLGRHLFETHCRIVVFGPQTDAQVARAQIQHIAGAFGHFTLPRMATFHVFPVRRHGMRDRSRGRGFLLSAEELATLWHPATATVRAPAMQTTQCRELEPPRLLPLGHHEPDTALLGRTKFRGRREVFGLRTDDRRRHLAVIGKTGMGKTTLLRQLIASDIAAGRGLALIDPHGDLAQTILDAVPSHRTNDVVLFDAGDRDFPLAFTPLACPQPAQRPLVASGVVSAFKKLYGDSWGPRLEHILRNALLALIEVPGTSLLSLQRLLADTSYRKMLTGRISDPIVKAFWDGEFAHWKPQYRAEAIAPIQNKVGQFLSHPILRAIVGQSRRGLDLRRVLDDGLVLIANLSKGTIGEDGSSLLGSLLVTGIQLAAMSRADTAEHQRRDFSLYVDEFQNFSTESFATVLSEARKYRLSLTIANQYLAQMDEATAAAVFGNVGSLLVFQVGASDAEALADQLGGEVTPQDLLALPRFTAYVRLLIDGMPSRPFSMETIPPPTANAIYARSAVIRRTSRHRYARPVKQVESEIHAAFASAG